PAARLLPRRGTTNLEAYDLFVHGRRLVFQSLDANKAARPLLKLGVAALDGELSLLLVGLAGCVIRPIEARRAWSRARRRAFAPSRRPGWLRYPPASAVRRRLWLASSRHPP